MGSVSAPGQKVWFITGSCSGFGREIALAALARGDVVVATALNPSKLANLVAKGAIAERLDVTDSDENLSEVVAKVLQQTNRIDILVNNAGYLLTGGVEECSRDEVQSIFNTNVFGQLNVIRAVLPAMRKQRSGVVANLGSMGSWFGSPAAGVYCATKACASMLSEALRGEVKHLGIQVTCIEPGHFRTNVMDQGHKVQAANVIEDLAEGVNPVLEAFKAYNHNQPGDPVKGAKLIVEALTGTGRAEGRALPPRFVIGTDAYKIVKGISEVNAQNLETWKDLITTTDHDDVLN
ncbi:hypothetical protein ACRALDRAFT_1064559 [Sodiomyces alcalophilus JCM 7366]|uniref:uncharacterized protein n=1 Tax=Sodiomyces alcalophilus JCM 7366 TaxID=591952 RepID=UPI0039B50E31